MGINRNFFKPVGAVFVFIFILTTVFFFYPFIDSIYPFRYCVGYWFWVIIAGFLFYVFPNIIYLGIAIKYFTKFKGKKVTSLSNVKTVGSTEKKVKKVAIAMGLAGTFFLSSILIAFVIMVAVLHTSLPTRGFDVPVTGKFGSIKIIRDTDNVPHIECKVLEDVAFSQGFVHAQERLFQLDYLRRVANGELHTLIRGEDSIASDTLAKTVGFRRGAERILESPILGNDTKSWLQAYARGINAYLVEGAIPWEMRYYNYWIDNPWSPVDSIAILKLWQWAYSGNFDRELSRFRLMMRGVPLSIIRKLEPAAETNGTSIFTAEELYTLRIPQNIESELNSLAAENNELETFQNQLDVVPKNDIEGETMYELMRDKWDGTTKTFGSLHRSFSTAMMVNPRTDIAVSNRPGFFISFDAKLNIPNMFMMMHLRFIPDPDPITEIEIPPSDGYGASLPGVPGIFMGRTQFLSWGLVPMMGDSMDFYILRETQRNERYIVDNVEKSYQVINETINGEPLRVLESEYGVVMTKDCIKDLIPSEQNFALALKWAGHNYSPSDTDMTIEWLFRAWRSTSTNQFRTHTMDLLHSPLVNVFYGDSEDQGFFIAAGKLPNRRMGHSGMFPVNANPNKLWNGYHSSLYIRPRINIRSIFAAGNSVMNPGHPYSFGYDFDDGYRVKHFRNRVKQQTEGRSITAALLREYTNDMKDALWFEFKPLLDLIDVSRLDQNEKSAYDKLSSWDGDSSYESEVDPIIFRGWYWELTTLGSHHSGIKYWNNPQYILKALSSNDPVCTQYSVSSCAEFATNAFKKSIEKYGTWGWGRGTYHRSPLRHLVFPDWNAYACKCSRFVSRPGTADTINSAPDLTPTNNFEATNGPAYRQVVEYGTNTFQAMIPLGNNGNQWSKAEYDQHLWGWLDNRYIPMSIIMADISVASQQQLTD